MTQADDLNAAISTDTADVAAKQAQLDADVAALAAAKTQLEADEAALAALPTDTPPALNTDPVPALTIGQVFDKIESVVEAGVSDVVQEVKALVAEGKSLITGDDTPASGQ